MLTMVSSCYENAQKAYFGSYISDGCAGTLCDCLLLLFLLLLLA